MKLFEEIRYIPRVGGSKLNAAARKLLIFMTFTKNHLFSMIFHLHIRRPCIGADIAKVEPVNSAENLF